MSTIGEGLSPEEKAVLAKLVAKTGVELEPNQDSIIDAQPAAYQYTEEVVDNIIIQKVGGVTKHEHEITHPNYGTKDLHPDRFIEEADAALLDSEKAQVTRDQIHARIDAANTISSPDALRNMVLGDEEPEEPAETLKKLTDEYICGHSGCGKSFPTKLALMAHKRASAHAEYAEGEEKWEQSFEYSRRKKKEAASDESADSGTDTKDEE